MPLGVVGACCDSSALALPSRRVLPTVRFLHALIELDVRISRIQLSDRFHVKTCVLRRLCRSTTPSAPCTSEYENRLVLGGS